MPTKECIYCGASFFNHSGTARYCDEHRCISYRYEARALNAKTRAKAFGLTQHYTGVELYEFCLKYGHECMRCRAAKYSFMGWVADHIVPLSLGGSNTIDNIQILCFTCNGAKRNYAIDYRQFAKPLTHSPH